MAEESLPTRAPASEGFEASAIQASDMETVSAGISPSPATSANTSRVRPYVLGRSSESATWTILRYILAPAILLAVLNRNFISSPDV